MSFLTDEKIKTATHIPDEKSYGVGIQRESCNKKGAFFPDDFG